MAISSWSTTPASNNSAAPNGFPEGMAASSYNDTARQIMADLRSWYEGGGWCDLGHTHTYGSATTTTVASDVTAFYLADRRVRAVGSSTGTIYGEIVSSVYSSPNTTITYLWDTGALSNEALTISVSFAAGNNAIPSAASPTIPTRQVFLSGSGTYTTAALCRWIEVELIGGGGGGGGSNDGGDGGTGGDTTFSTLTGSGGLGGLKGATSNGGLAGIGGAATGGDFNLPGGAGQSTGGSGNGNNQPGGNGGSGYFGGGGRSANGTNNGGAGATNTGGGGGGGGENANAAPGSGGGAGGYVNKIIGSPSATYSYAVGAAGAAGSAGTTAGGAGAAGIIIVTEHYS